MWLFVGVCAPTSFWTKALGGHVGRSRTYARHGACYRGLSLGNWTLDIRGVTGLDDPTTLAQRPTTLKATSSNGGSSTVTITYK